MDKKTRANKILILLEKNYLFVPNLFLNYKTDAQMVCAIILSAQSTDAQINKLTKNLFKKYKSINDFANADLKEFEKEIFSSGFYKNKAKNIINCFKQINNKYNKKIPLSMEKLILLPGIGRKTANLILLNKGIVSGIAVDTHVARLSYHLGLTISKNPIRIENDLLDLYAKKDWSKINKLFISHGRVVCIARKPLCEECFLNSLCPKKGV